MDIDSLDQRARLASAAAAAFLFSMVQSPAALLAGAAGSFFLACLAKYPLSLLLKRLAPANIFLLFLLLTVPWSMPGPPLLNMGFLSFSREGLELVIQSAVKCNCILAVFLILTAGMSIAEMGSALERMHVPAKLVFLFLFTFRHIHVIGAEWKRMWTAAELRGFCPRTSLHTYRTIAHMLGMAVISSIDRSRRVYEAMQLRGFQGIFHTAAETNGRGLVFTTCFLTALFALTAADVLSR